MLDEELVLEIFKNFEKDYKEYKSTKKGRIAKLFESQNITDQKSIKAKLKNKESVGYGQKKGSNLHGLVVLKFEKNNFFIGHYENNKKNGYGYHYFVNGLVYKGQYKDDIKVDGVVIDPMSKQIVY